LILLTLNIRLSIWFLSLKVAFSAKERNIRIRCHVWRWMCNKNVDVYLGYQADGKEKVGKHREWRASRDSKPYDRSKSWRSSDCHDPQTIHTIDNGRRRRAYGPIALSCHGQIIQTWRVRSYSIGSIVPYGLPVARRYSFQNILHTSVQENVFLLTWTQSTPRMRVRGERPSPFIWH